MKSVQDPTDQRHCPKWVVGQKGIPCAETHVSRQRGHQAERDPGQPNQLIIHASLICISRQEMSPARYLPSSTKEARTGFTTARDAGSVQSEKSKMTSTYSVAGTCARLLIASAVMIGSAIGVTGVAHAATSPAGRIIWAQGDGDTSTQAANNLTKAKYVLCGELWTNYDSAKITRRQDGGYTARQQIMCG